jgi:hypothetical protein
MEVLDDTCVPLAHFATRARGAGRFSHNSNDDKPEYTPLVQRYTPGYTVKSEMAYWPEKFGPWPYAHKYESWPHEARFWPLELIEKNLHTIEYDAGNWMKLACNKNAAHIVRQAYARDARLRRLFFDACIYVP